MRLRYQQKLSRRRGGRFDPGARLDKAFKNRVRRERWKISPLVGRGGEVQDTTSATQHGWIKRTHSVLKGKLVFKNPF